MPTDFAAVHAHLEKLQPQLGGADETTRHMRETIHMLMDMALRAQFSPSAGGKVVLFPGGRNPKTSRSA